MSERALRVALDEYPDADVTALHVIDPTSPGYSYSGAADADLDHEPRHGSEAWYERSQELADELFETVARLADEYGTAVTTETVVGEPGREIVEYARDHDVDQVVLGRHGRDDEERQLVGSVTEAVVFRSPVRVLVVH